jgi:type IV secretion system protein VirB4
MGRIEAARAHEAERRVGEFLPYSHHVTPTIIATRGGEYLSVWRLEGRSHQTASDVEQGGWIDDLSNAVRGIAGAGVAFWSHVVRRRVHEYPEARYENVFCKRLHERYAESLRGCHFMLNELFLTVVLKRVGDDVLETLGRLEKESVVTKAQRQQEAIAKLDDLNRILGVALRRYGAELLGLYESAERHVFSSALEFLASLVNGERLRMPVCRGRFGEYMMLNRPFFARHGEVGELRLPSKTRRFGLLEFFEYDGTGTDPQDLDELLKADFEFVLSQSWTALSKQSAKGFLELHKQRLLETQDVAKSQIAEIDVALDELVSGRFIMGEHHATLLAFGDEVGEVRDHLAWARSALLDRGIVAKPVDLALEAAFWAQLPANWRWRPRAMALTSQNFLCFSPFHNFMAGKPAGNPWGPAVTVLRTPSGSPLYFSFHASPADQDSKGERLLGNTALLGQAGAGKTALLGFLVAQAQKFEPTIVAFDKDRGLDVAVRAMGGRYFPLRLGEATRWNPFQLEPTSGNTLFLKELVRSLVMAGGHPVNHREETEIDTAVNSLMTLIDRTDRRLSVLLQFLPDVATEDRDAHPSVAARLRKWCAGGQYGWVFDHQRDELDLGSHRLYGFDITEFLDNAEVRAPMMKYLIYRTKAMLGNRRFIYLFDEWWKAVSADGFAELTKDLGKTIRKQDGILVVSTQEPDDALKSSVGKSVLEQSATLILLRNPKATRADYVDGLHLTEKEYELVRTLPEDSRRFLVKQGENSVLAELDLGELKAELSVLSGSPDRARLVDELVRERGDAPEQWLPAYFERVGVPA